MVDNLVLLDNVPYSRNSVCNRNKIKTSRGWEWLTVPVHHRFGEEILEIETDDSGWEGKHWKTILFNYSRAPHFDEFSPGLEDIYAKRWTKLAELNEALIRLLLDYFNILTRIYKASDLGVGGKGTALLVNICKAVADGEYLSGAGADGYLEPSVFEKEGISVRFQQFVCPEYPQRFGEFIRNLSAIDYLFNCGAKAWF